MRPTRSIISFLLLAAILVPLQAQQSSLSSVDAYVVEEGDSMYWISRTVYSEAEKLDGAHWLAIFEYNVEQGRVNPVRTPIQLGPKGLFLHIEPGQKLLIPHYAGLFPSPGAIALHYGVHDESGAPLAGFVPDFPPMPARSVRELPNLASVAVESANIESTDIESTDIESTDIESVAPAVSIPAVDAVGDEQPSVFVIPGLAQTSGLSLSIDEAAFSLADPGLATALQVAVPVTGSALATVIEPAVLADELAKAREEVKVEIYQEALAQARAEVAAEAAAVAATAPTTKAAGGASRGSDSTAEEDTRAVARAEAERKAIFRDGVELSFIPGAGFFDDLVGLHVTVGVQASLATILERSLWFRDFMLGASLMYQQVLTEEIPVLMAGLDTRVGYRIDLARLIPDLPRALQFRIIPTVTNGILFQRINRIERELYLGPAYHLAGGMSVDMALLASRSLRLGVELDYNLYLSSLRLTNISSGLFMSWTF